MRILRQRWISHGLVLGGFGLAAAAWPSLPDRIPTHWNLEGNPDGFGGKTFGLLVLPTAMLLVHGLLELIPRISPRDWPIAPFAAAYETLRIAILGFLLYVMVLMVAAGLGHAVAMTPLLMGGLGALFLVVGSQLDDVTPNYFVGIRTPWTLADREVWRRTHALGARSFMAGGVTMVVAALSPSRMVALALFVLAITGSALVPVVASWRYSRERDRNANIT